jgi:hypothetical protein
MPEHKDPLAKQARSLADQATEAFNQGVHDRGVGADYVRVTLILAAVLFLLATGQRLRIRGVRLTVIGVAGASLVYCVVLQVIYPHA